MISVKHENIRDDIIDIDIVYLKYKLLMNWKTFSFGELVDEEKGIIKKKKIQFKYRNGAHVPVIDPLCNFFKCKDIYE